MRMILSIFLLVTSVGWLSAQDNASVTPNSLFAEDVVKPRFRVIIDNDFSGDPDGLFQLVHHILSPSVEIRAIVGSHLKQGDFFDKSEITATHAKEKAEEILTLMNLKGTIPVYEGSNKALDDLTVPKMSDASEAIIKEALREDTKQPLFVVCGAGLTDLASAFLKEPKIANRLTLIWIGGPEYPEIAPPPPGYTSLEYNLGIDIKAGQVIFNNSVIPIWQVPRNAYREVMIPYSSLVLHVKDKGPIGSYLVTALEQLMRSATGHNYFLGETYIIGDSPLVLLTALQSSFEADPSSSKYVLRQSPIIDDKGLYSVNHAGRNIRVYGGLDVRLLIEDFYSKLTLFHQKNAQKLSTKNRK